MPDNEAILSGLFQGYKYPNSEAIKRAQEHAYALMKQPDEKYTSWTQGARDIVNALSGRATLNQTNEQQAGLMKQAASATAGALPVPTSQEQSSQTPQVKIEGYNGTPPPMHQIPNKEQVEAYAMQLPAEAREKYLEKMNELAKPYAIEVPGGKLHANPRTQQWTFQPELTKTEVEGVPVISHGQNAGQIPTPGKNIFQAGPIKVNSEEELKKLKKGTPVILPDGSKGFAP